MVWFRGVNIFEGYLKDEKRTAEVLRDGWFKTGDIGRFDEDGFLYIEGRLSRFSKIGGEMVPHEALEQKIITALGLDGKDERLIAIVGVADETKGEAVLLLANHISPFDPFIISSVVRRKIDWMAMAEFFPLPLLRFLLRAVDAFPADRDRADHTTIRTAIERLKDGRIVGIFPEGGIRNG